MTHCTFQVVENSTKYFPHFEVKSTFSQALLPQKKIIFERSVYNFELCTEDDSYSWKFCQAQFQLVISVQVQLSTETGLINTVRPPHPSTPQELEIFGVRRTLEF